MQDDIAPSRAIAIALGLSKYQGAPCKAGHAGIRRVTNKACIDCARQYDKAHKAAHADSERERKAAWRKANPEKRQAERQRYQATNKQAISERAKAYRQADPYGTIAKRQSEAAAESAKRKQARDKARAEREAYRKTEEYRLARKAERKAARAAKLAALDEFELDDLQKRERARYEALKASDPKGLRFLWRIHSSAKRAKRKNPDGNHDATTEQLRMLFDWQEGKCAYCGAGDPLDIDHKVPLVLGGDHTIQNLQWLCRFHNHLKSEIPDSEFRRLMGIPSVTPWE